MYQIRETLKGFLSLKDPDTERGMDVSLRLQAQYLGVTMWTREWEAQFKRFSVRDAAGFIFWLAARPGQGGGTASDGTLRLRINLMRSIYRHLSAVGDVYGNPFDAVRHMRPARRKKQKRPTKLIPFDKVRAITDAPNQRTKKGVMHRALLSIMFGGGLRRSEVAKLNIDDVATTPAGTPFLVLRDAKAGTDQEQALPGWAWEAFSVLVSQRKSEGAFEGDPLFVFYYRDGRPRGRISAESIYRLYKKYCALVGIEGAAPHSARATGASYLKHLGHDDRDVADWLRHAGPQMVQTYDKRARGPETSIAPDVDFEKVETVRKTA